MVGVHSHTKIAIMPMDAHLMLCRHGVIVHFVYISLSVSIQRILVIYLF